MWPSKRLPGSYLLGYLRSRSLRRCQLRTFSFPISVWKWCFWRLVCALCGLRCEA